MAMGEERWASQINAVSDALGKEKLYYFPEIIQHVPRI